MRLVLSVRRDGEALSVLEQSNGTVREIPISLESNYRGVIHSLGLRLETDQDRTSGHWMVDYRQRDTCSVPVLIERALSLTEDTYVALFEFIRDDAPEYEKGFRHITDQIHRFCMLLLAQAVANEKLSRG
jgi:hypothetical protein